MFNQDTTLKTIITCPPLVASRPYWCSDAVLAKMNRGDLTLNDLERYSGGAYKAIDLVDGFNHLYQTALSHSELAFPIYSDVEITLDASKQNIGVLSFPIEGSSRFVLICPGGGYRMVATFIEGLPLAKALNAQGISAYILNYRVGLAFDVEKADEDLRQALRFCLEREQTTNYALFGFSAGGHLVSGLLTANRGWQHSALPQPEFVGLSYPLLTLPSSISQEDKLYHNYQTMFGEDLNQEIISNYDSIRHLLSDLPPIYLWQTKDDEVVSFEDNALRLSKVLQERKTAYRFKTVSTGPHGLGMGTGSAAQGWVEEALDFWMTTVEETTHA